MRNLGIQEFKNLGNQELIRIKQNNMKTYIKPRIMEMDVQPQSMISTSPTTGTVFGINNNEGTGTTDLSNSRRGSWGNIWGEEE